MSRTILLSLPCALLLLGTGCPPAAYGGLDSNRDGALAPDDLEPGEAAAYLDLGPDGDGVESGADDDDDDDDGGDDTGTALTMIDMYLEPAFTEGVWYFQGTLVGETTNYDLSIRFENQDPLAVDSGDVVGGSFNAEDNSVYAYGGEAPGGRMEITEASEARGSGGLLSVTRFEIIEGDMPTGRDVVIEAFAFREIEVREPVAMR